MKPIISEQNSVYFNEEGYLYINNLLKEKNYSVVFILVDENTHEHCLPIFLPKLETNCTIEIIEVVSGEENKNIETCLGIWQTLSDFDGDRKSLLINVGGGVVTDMGGFVASTFKRGIDFINIPTTLLAMVDASVGGKTGVDLGVLKNQIGVINQPEVVIVDPSYLATLEKNQLISGFAEMLKHGLIKDAAYWNTLKNGVDFDNILAHIYTSVSIKNEVVTIDPTEQGLRKILNFGHTLGHAIESYCLENTEKQTLLHGEAIAIGMVLEAYLAYGIQELSKVELDEIKSVFAVFYKKMEFSTIDIDAIISLLKFDKKNSHGIVNFVLISKIGEATIDKKIENSLIFDAFNYYKA